MGDPMRPLLWVSKSHEKLADALRAGTRGQRQQRQQLLPTLGYPRQATARRKKAAHPDRDAQFEHINAPVIASQAAGQPVISIDTKKKELIGDTRTAAATIGRRAARPGQGA